MLALLHLGKAIIDLTVPPGKTDTGSFASVALDNVLLMVATDSRAKALIPVMLAMQENIRSQVGEKYVLEINREPDART